MTHGRPNVTMFTDASVFPNYKRSGWGCWIKGDGRESMSFGGPLQNFHPDSVVAELEAIANGIVIAKDRGYFQPDDKVIMIQSDSAFALACLLKARPSIVQSRHEDGAKVIARRKKLGPRLLAPATAIIDTLDELEMHAVIRHVRGHKSGNGRQWVNRLCDRLAKQGALEGMAAQ